MQGNRFATIFSTALIALCPLFLLLGCDNAPPEAKKPKRVDSSQESLSTPSSPIRGRLVYRLAGEPDTLNFLTQRTPSGKKLTRYHLNFKLLERHPQQLGAIPWLAATMPEESANGLIHTWTLKKRATWSDGIPVTANDALTAWQIINSEDPSLALPFAQARAVLANIESIEVLGQKRFSVRYKTKTPHAAFDFGLKFSPVPTHALPNPVSDITKIRALPGSGPYRLASWKDGVIEFDRILDWWGNKDASFANRFSVRTFVYKVIVDTVQAIEQLKAGKIDFAAIGTQAYVKLMKEADRYQLKGTHYYLPQWSFIGFNCSNPILGDVRVRRAISLLIPRKKINDQFYAGLARPISGPFFADSMFNDPSISARPYNPFAAKKLLEAAGWVDRNGDGILDKNGEKLRFILSRSKAGLSWSSGLIERIKDSLAQSGIVMEVETLAWSEIRKSCELAQHDAYAQVWEIDVNHPGADLRATFHSSQCIDGLNWQQFKNPTLDLLIDKMLTANDDGERVASAHRIQALIHQEVPMAFLFNNPACIVWQDRVKGVKAYALGIRQWDFKVGKP